MSAENRCFYCLLHQNTLLTGGIKLPVTSLEPAQEPGIPEILSQELRDCLLYDIAPYHPFSSLLAQVS